MPETTKPQKSALATARGSAGVRMDHRRLEQSMLRKAFHSIFGCLFLYCDLILARWRKLDWDY